MEVPGAHVSTMEEWRRGQGMEFGEPITADISSVNEPAPVAEWIWEYCWKEQSSLYQKFQWSHPIEIRLVPACHQLVVLNGKTKMTWEGHLLSSVVDALPPNGLTTYGTLCLFLMTMCDSHCWELQVLTRDEKCLRGSFFLWGVVLASHTLNLGVEVFVHLLFPHLAAAHKAATHGCLLSGCMELTKILTMWDPRYCTSLSKVF